MDNMQKSEQELELIKKNEQDIEPNICRICHCESESDRPLYYPCKCTGSIKYVHQDCLMKWTSISGNKKCSLCGYDLCMQVTLVANIPHLQLVFGVILSILCSIKTKIISFLTNFLLTIFWILISTLSSKSFILIFNDLKLEQLSNEKILLIIMHFLCGLPILCLTCILCYNLEDINRKLKRKKEFQHYSNKVLQIVVNNFLHMTIDFWNFKSALFYLLVSPSFIFLVIYCPYKIAYFILTLMSFKLDSILSAEIVFIVMIYGQMGILLLLSILRSVKHNFWKSTLGSLITFWFYLTKTTFLNIVQWIILPIAYGYWFDFCATPIYHTGFDETFDEYIEIPLLVLILHWTYGIFYKLLLLNTLQMLQKIIHPNLLNNIDKQLKPYLDVDPFTKAIYLSLMEYACFSFESSLLICGMIYLNLQVPIQLLNLFGFLNTIKMYELYRNYFVIRCIVVRTVVGAYGQMLLNVFCSFTLRTLGMLEYLLPYSKEENGPPHIRERQQIEGDVDLFHQANPEPLVRELIPKLKTMKLKALRISGLIVMGCISVILFSMLIIVLDDFMGSQGIDYILDSYMELIKIAVCVLFVYIFFNLLCTVVAILSKGRTALWNFIRHAVHALVNYLALILTLLIAYKFGGLLIKFILCEPLPIIIRNGVEELGYLEDGVFSAGLFKIWYKYAPDCRLKRGLQHISSVGARNVELKYILFEITIPTIKYLVLPLAVPYILTKSILLKIITDFETQILIMRFNYLWAFIVYQLLGYSYRFIAYLQNVLLNHSNQVKIKEYVSELRLVNYNGYEDDANRYVADSTNGVITTLENVPTNIIMEII